MRPCGMAMPWPSPVEPRRSRGEQAVEHGAAGDALIVLEQQAGLFKTRFLLLASRSITTLESGRSWDIRLIRRWARALFRQLPPGAGIRSGRAAALRENGRIITTPGRGACRSSGLGDLVLEGLVVICGRTASACTSEPDGRACRSSRRSPRRGRRRPLSTKRSLPRTCSVTSAFCLSFSTDRMTVTLVTLSKWRMTRSSLEVTYSRMAG